MPTGKALPALHNSIWVTSAAQLQVHLTIWETAVEEIWPRPERTREQLTQCNFTTVSLLIYCVGCCVYLPTTSLMTLVKTPFKTRVKVTAGGQRERQKYQKSPVKTWRLGSSLCYYMAEMVKKKKNHDSSFFCCRCSVSKCLTIVKWLLTWTLTS